MSRYENVFDAMLVYLTKHLSQRNKTLVEEYHVKLSRKYLLLPRLFRLLRKRSGISGKYMDKKASLNLQKETTLRYRLASMYHSNRNESAISGIGIVNQLVPPLQ